MKGNSSMRGDKVHLELRLYVVSRGADEVLKKDYDVAPTPCAAPSTSSTTRW